MAINIGGIILAAALTATRYDGLDGGDIAYSADCSISSNDSRLSRLMGRDICAAISPLGYFTNFSILMPRKPDKAASIGPPVSHHFTIARPCFIHTDVTMPFCVARFMKKHMLHIIIDDGQKIFLTRNWWLKFYQRFESQPHLMASTRIYLL